MTTSPDTLERIVAELREKIQRHVATAHQYMYERDQSGKVYQKTEQEYYAANAELEAALSRLEKLTAASVQVMAFPFNIEAVMLNAARYQFCYDNLEIGKLEYDEAGVRFIFNRYDEKMIDLAITRPKPQGESHGR